MNCPVCDAPLPKNVSECPNCGAVIDWENLSAAPVTARDTAAIRRQALMRMAIELVRSQEFSAALLVYRRALKGLKPSDPLFAEVQKRMERLNRQQLQAKAPSAGRDTAPEPASPASEADYPAAHFVVRWPVAYLTGLVLALVLSQLLKFSGFHLAAQIIFTLMLIWAAYSGRWGLLALEWLVGFGGSALFSTGPNGYVFDQWLFLAIEGWALDLIFFYGLRLDFTRKIFIGLFFAAFVFFLTPLFSLSILQLFLNVSPLMLAVIGVVFLSANRNVGNTFHRLFHSLCQAG